MDLTLLPLAVFVFISFIAIGFTGFGGMIIPVTLGAHLYPISWILNVLVPISPLGNVIIFWRHRQHIQFGLLLKRLFPAMVIGAVIGLGAFHYLPEEFLKRVFGGLIIVVSLTQLNNLRKKKFVTKAFHPVFEISQFFLAGIIHGVFATGGPVLVYVLSRMKLDKAEFRATLSTVWMVMNIFLTIAYLISGRVDLSSLKNSAILIIPLLAGLFVGESLHDRINEQKFKVAVFILLLVIGLSILIR